MKNEFVTYEQALALKELGFNEECFATWNGDTLDMSFQTPSDDYFTQAPLKQQVLRWFRDNFTQAPLRQQVLRWFREKYDGEHWIGKRAGKLYVIRYVFLKDEAITFGEDSIFNTYEEAENACIDKLIELAKQQ